METRKSLDGTSHPNSNPKLNANNKVDNFQIKMNNGIRERAIDTSHEWMPHSLFVEKLCTYIARNASIWNRKYNNDTLIVRMIRQLNATIILYRISAHFQFRMFDDLITKKIKEEKKSTKISIILPVKLLLNGIYRKCFFFFFLSRLDNLSSKFI